MQNLVMSFCEIARILVIEKAFRNHRAARSNKVLENVRCRFALDFGCVSHVIRRISLAEYRAWDGLQK